MYISHTTICVYTLYIYIYVYRPASQAPIVSRHGLCLRLAAVSDRLRSPNFRSRSMTIICVRIHIHVYINVISLSLYICIYILYIIGKCFRSRRPRPELEPRD